AVAQRGRDGEGAGGARDRRIANAGECDAERATGADRRAAGSSQGDRLTRHARDQGPVQSGLGGKGSAGDVESVRELDQQLAVSGPHILGGETEVHIASGARRQRGRRHRGAGEETPVLREAGGGGRGVEQAQSAGTGAAAIAAPTEELRSRLGSGR